MWQIAAGDGVVLGLAAVHVAVAWRGRRRFHRRLTVADDAIFYGWIPRTFVVGVVMLWALVLATTGALGAHSESLFESVLVNAVFLAALLLPVWALTVEFFGTEYHVTPDGLRKHSPWTRNFEVRWDELESAEVEASSGWLVVRTEKGMIRIHGLIRDRWKVASALEAHGVRVGA